MEIKVLMKCLVKSRNVSIKLLLKLDLILMNLSDILTGYNLIKNTVLRITLAVHLYFKIMLAPARHFSTK